MKKYLLLLVLLPYFSFALTSEERLQNEAAETRAHEIFRQIRCVVCAGESINDSKADIAKSLRIAIRQKILEGKSDEQIIADITNSYGDSILMKPPFEEKTYLLWFMPLILLAIGGLLVAYSIRKNHKNV
jgi:cytochrome c-type biogenesis protein CcmH